METAFWDRKVVLRVEFIQLRPIITSDVRCETQKKKLLRATQNEMCGMLTYGVVLLHDNKRSHTAARTQALLKHFNWELFDYPPYSPDLAPERLPPVYLPEEVVCITVLQQS
jgi:transposase